MPDLPVTRPVWAEVSRGRLRENYRALQAVAPGVELLAVVKADAYGHGVELCAPVCAAAGARWLGVTSVEEGVRVRAVCPDSQILVMSGLHRGEAGDVLDSGLTPAVWEHYHLDLLEAEAARRGLTPGSVPVHLELDTGMARQGVPVPATDPSAMGELTTLLLRFNVDSPLRVEAVATHFHSPEVAGGGTGMQLERLAAALDLVRLRGVQPAILHAGNSATLLGGAEQGLALASLERLALAHGMRLMLRPGLALYGYAPAFSPPEPVGVAHRPGTLRPVLAWKTRISSLRTVAAGETVGYNATFRAYRPARLALLPVGYADGYNRLLSNQGHVLVQGERAPVAGRVSMDQVVVDVSDVPDVKIGDEVVLLGEQSTRSLSAEDLAALTGTIPYEVLCDIGARVPRVAVD